MAQIRLKIERLGWFLIWLTETFECELLKDDDEFVTNGHQTEPFTTSFLELIH
jgi:hypothetical protein